MRTRPAPLGPSKLMRSPPPVHPSPTPPPPLPPTLWPRTPSGSWTAAAAAAAEAVAPDGAAGAAAARLADAPQPPPPPTPMPKGSPEPEDRGHSVPPPPEPAWDSGDASLICPTPPPPPPARPPPPPLTSSAAMASSGPKASANSSYVTKPSPSVSIFPASSIICVGVMSMPSHVSPPYSASYVRRPSCSASKALKASNNRILLRRSAARTRAEVARDASSANSSCVVSARASGVACQGTRARRRTARMRSKKSARFSRALDCNARSSSDTSCSSKST
mmetsp:Transcript_16751/g.41238  ORF Transcript_16751/g.41238 Transcript_16751/m.41238 type:complete len:278 (-) Transcript_16751:4693-5526(-)